MKAILTSVFLLSFAIGLTAQEARSGQEQHYIFPTFIEGTVKQKSGEVIKVLLNYNALTEEMIFDQEGKKLALDKLENVDTVFIGERKFIPVGNVFYEKATNGHFPLFIQHQCQLLPPGNNTGFGTSQTGAISNMRDLKSQGLAYKLKLPDDFLVIFKTKYWLKKNNNFYIINNEKNLMDLFPDKADVIKKYVKGNKLSFKKTSDLVKITTLCNSL
jgi:hypothetical protein